MSDIDNEELGLDETGFDQEQVTTTSLAGISRELDRVQAAKKAKSKRDWKTRPVRSFFSKVALPSTLLGLASYGLSMAHGTPNEVMAVASGALWYPAHTVREPVSRFLGKVDGAIRNLASSFNKNAQETYFQQKTQEINYAGWSDGALTVGLLTGAVLLPTYGEIIANTAVSTYHGAGYVIDVVSEGIKAVSSQAPAPK